MGARKGQSHEKEALLKSVCFRLYKESPQPLCNKGGLVFFPETMKNNAAPSPHDLSTLPPLASNGKHKTPPSITAYIHQILHLATLLVVAAILCVVPPRLSSGSFTNEHNFALLSSEHGSLQGGSHSSSLLKIKSFIWLLT